MVREVGFEPTNPYGTGASGLRVQDPFSHHRVSLTWLANTSRRKHGLPHTSQNRSRREPSPGQGPNWLSPAPTLHQKTGKCLIQAQPTPATNQDPSYHRRPGETRPIHGHETSEDKTPTSQPMPRLGTVRPTPRLRNAGRTRKRRMETPPMEQRNPLRMGDRKNRIHTSQPERPEHDQRRRIGLRNRHANHTGQD